MTAATITAAQLEALDACPPQLEMFRATFGERLAFRSEAACVRCAAKHAQTFDWDWAARNLLRAPARKAYEEARATAWKAYEEAKAPAQKAYEEARATARKAYEEARATARKAYEEAVAPARKAYEEAKASAFARVWFRQETTT